MAELFEQAKQWYFDTLTWNYRDEMIMDRHPHDLPWIAVGIYFFIVFLGGKVVGFVKKGGFESAVKPFMALWNIILSVYSLGILLGVGVPFVKNIMELGFDAQICDETVRSLCCVFCVKKLN